MYKNFIITIILSLMWLLPLAQSYGSLNIISENDMPFLLRIDGMVINEKPVQSIRVANMFRYSYHVELILSDSASTQLTHPKLFICNKAGVRKDMTYRIHTDSGRAKFSFMRMRFAESPDPTLTYECLFDFSTGKRVDRSQSVSSSQASAEVQAPIQPQKIRQIPRSNPVAPSATDAVKALVMLEPVQWGCQKAQPADSATFLQAYQLLSQASSDADRLSLFPAWLGSSCWRVEQIRNMALLFEGESPRLSFVRQAYARTVDIHRYLELFSLFSQERYRSSLAYFITH